MSYKLFLDDERDPYKVKHVQLPLGPWVIARNYQEFVAAIEEKGLPSFVAFDHDLAFEHYPFAERNPGPNIPYDSYKEKTGYHCAEFLLQYCEKNNIDLPNYIVHSMNTVGKKNIKRILQTYAARRNTI